LNTGTTTEISGSAARARRGGKVGDINPSYKTRP
jgi:hypothetical protein